MKKSFLYITKLDQKYIIENKLIQIYESIDNLKKLINKVFNLNRSIENKTVLLKPNLVLHPSKDSDLYCLTTHFNFILAVLEIVLEKSPKKVIIGDAPIQGCRWDKLVDLNFIQKVEQYSNQYSIPIIIKDFRRTVSNLSDNQISKGLHPLSDYIIFDLAKKSFLEPISSTKPIFRVTNYDPDKLANSHSIGMHKYCITKELFESDIVISIPKVKTHQKAGITCALKNLVGINGDKDFLPHHRVGGSGFGGDCYPGKNYLRRLSEYFLDQANRNIGNPKYYYWLFLSKVFWKINKKTSKHHLAAGWYGNDTTWRMVLDINTIAKYGRLDGTLSEKPQREIYSLCDCVIGGQGDGPLHPEPINLGIITFSNHSALTDAAIAKIMNFDIKKIPLIKNALKHFPTVNVEIKLNGNEINIDDLQKLKTFVTPPPGWIGNIENES